MPFDLPALVEDTCALLAERARTKGLELLCMVHSDVPCGVIGDPTRLAQVLTNLVGNAIKFTHRGEVVVRASLLGVGESGAEVRFEVEDTGIGITPGEQARLFVPFAQGDGSTTRRFGGTGLGLSISKQLVTLMGATLELRSEPGHGSAFSFAVRYPEQPADELEARSGAGFEGFRVLVVDDNAKSCAILSHHLEAWDVRHDVTDDPSRALDLMGIAAMRGVPYGLVFAFATIPSPTSTSGGSRSGPTRPWRTATPGTPPAPPPISPSRSRPTCLRSGSRTPRRRTTPAATKAAVTTRAPRRTTPRTRAGRTRATRTPRRRTRSSLDASQPVSEQSVRRALTAT